MDTGTGNEPLAMPALPEGVVTPDELTKKIIERRNTAWEKVLDTVRGAVRKAKKLAADAPVSLPAAPAGTYVKQAIDRHGLYAMPKQRGKINHHWSPFANAVKSLSIEIFERELVMFRQAKIKAAADASTAPKDVSEAEEAMIAHKCYKIAFRHLKNKRKNCSAARRERQESSRRINRGLSIPNQDRQAHAEA